jgi:hypothetical protein
MSTTPRVDVYGRIHRGLRKALFDLAYLAGRTDWRDDEEVTEVENAARGVMRFLRHHGHNEDMYSLPILMAKNPALVIEDSAEHQQIEKEIDGLEEMLEGIRSIGQEYDRCAEGERYYHRLLLFISDYIRHMHKEETTTTALFYTYCTDEEIEEGTRRILANTPPADMGYALAFMIPAIDKRDRVALFSTMRPVAPPPAFDAACAIAERTLDSAEWSALHTALSPSEILA